MEIKQMLKKLSESMRVTGIVCGRTVRTENGEVSVTFQVDPTGEDEHITLRDVRVASHLVALQADIAAHEQALASGLITPQYFQDKVRSLKTKYGMLVSLDLGESDV